MSYFAGRAAPMGAVGAGVVTATFYNFSPSLVAHMIPRAWTLASPGAGRRAPGWDAARASLTRLLGDEAIDSAGVRRAGRAAARGLRRATPEGRPLYAGHADLRWPERAAAAGLWHGADAAARAPRRRAHRRAARRRPQRPRGADHPHRHRPRLHRGRRHRPPAAGATRSGRRRAPRWPSAACSTTPGSPPRARTLRARVEAETDVLSRRPVAAPRRGAHRRG